MAARLAAGIAFFFLFASPVSAMPLTALSEVNSLYPFDSTSPTVVGTPVAITGLGPGENIMAIDARPANGALYGVSMTAGGTARLYRIARATGQATAIGPSFSAPLEPG